jgi:hypothetical protein
VLSEEQDPAMDVATELAEVANRLVGRTFNPLGKKPELPIPRLRKLAEDHFPDEWQRDRSVALESLLKAAFDGLDVLDGQPQAFRLQTKMTEREMAYRLFNIAEPGLGVRRIDPEHITDGKKYAYIVKQAMRSAELDTFSDARMESFTKVLREKVARILLDPRFPFAIPTSTDLERLPQDNLIRQLSANVGSLVTRDDDIAWLHATYRDLVQKDGGLFQLWGIAGIGKTTLAMQFADQVEPQGVIGVIRIGRRGLSENDLRHVLRLEGYDESAWSDEYCLTKFRVVVRQLRCIRLLIFDGVEDATDVIGLIPNGACIPVLITARERLRFPGDANAQLRAPSARRVRTFSDEQCDLLLRRHLVDLDDETVDALGEAVGGHPESLMHIVHCLMLDDVTPTSLLEDLSRRPRQALIDMMNALDVQDCAANAIEKLLRQLDPSSLAYTILICLIWAEEFGQLPRSFLLALVSAFRNEQPSLLALRAAFGQLEQLGLLGQTGDFVAMSRMTCQVLRDLLIESYASVMLAYERVVAAPLDDQALPMSLLNTCRLEYDLARPLRLKLANDLDNTHEQAPALICIDKRNWALLVTGNSSGIRYVTMYRVTPGALLALGPRNPREWEIIPNEDCQGILDAVRYYYELMYEEWKKRRNRAGLNAPLPITD